MRLLLSFFLLFISVTSFVQQEQVYDVNANAAADIEAAIKQAKAQNKHVFLQIGGNWCGWCLRFNKWSHENDTIRAAMEKNYVVVHVNYSKENRNEKVMTSLGFPQRFGFPVFVILDAKGNRIHTQNTGLLEAGSGYSTHKVVEFLEQWSLKALDPAGYKKDS